MQSRDPRYRIAQASKNLTETTLRITLKVLIASYGILQLSIQVLRGLPRHEPRPTLAKLPAHAVLRRDEVLEEPDLTQGGTVRLRGTTSIGQ